MIASCSRRQLRGAGARSLATTAPSFRVACPIANGRRTGVIPGASPAARRSPPATQLPAAVITGQGPSVSVACSLANTRTGVRLGASPAALQPTTHAPARLAPSTTVYDFRSDTVTKPTKGMLDAMCAAATGDDVYGEDASVLRLEERVADLFGKESAVFVTSGTLSNQLALDVHLRRLQEVVCDARSHIVCWENGGIHAFTGASTNEVDPTRFGEDHLTAARIRDVWRLDNMLYHQVGRSSRILVV